jgi:hypothetical protein
MDDYGWVLGPNSELLFWVPPDLRTGLYRPNNALVIGKCITTKLDVSSFAHGESWTNCKGGVVLPGLCSNTHDVSFSVVNFNRGEYGLWNQ